MGGVAEFYEVARGLACLEGKISVEHKLKEGLSVRLRMLYTF